MRRSRQAVTATRAQQHQTTTNAMMVSEGIMNSTFKLPAVPVGTIDHVHEFQHLPFGLNIM